jgi:hypothetical protein
MCHHDFTCALRLSVLDPRELNSSDEESEPRDSIPDGHLYVSVEHEIGYLLIKRPCSRKEPFENVDLFSDQLKAIAGRHVALVPVFRNLFCRFALGSPNRGSQSGGFPS